MQVPLEVTGHHVSVSPRTQQLIEQKVSKLEKYYDRVISCRVVLEGPDKHHKTGSPFKARIHLGVPGNEITIDRQQGANLPAAIQSAFDAANRKLQDYSRTRRGDVKKHADSRPELEPDLVLPDI